MDPLSIVSLVGNVAQFLQLGFEIAALAREAYTSATGTTRECEQLRLLIGDIKRNTDLVKAKSFPDEQAADVKSLSKMAEDCDNIAQELLVMLEKPGTRRSGWMRGYDSAKVAIKAALTKKGVNELLRRLMTLEGRLLKWWEKVEAQCVPG